MAVSPLAIFAASDQVRAALLVVALGNVPSVAIASSDLSQTVQSLVPFKTQVDASDPIILMVSAGSASSALFQSIAVYVQSQSKRLIVIDLDSAGLANVVGNIKSLSDTVISASDPKLPEILDTADRWTLPDGSPYPEEGIKHQAKC